MRTRWLALVLAAVFCGALGGTLFAPQPAGAVSKEMIELQQQVAQILQGQQDLRSTVDGNNAAIRTLVQQSLDSVNKLNGEMSSVQKSVQEVQANTGARIDSMTQQTQGLSDNMQDVQARVAKLSQQLTDVQNLLQSIDAKVSGGSDDRHSAREHQSRAKHGRWFPACGSTRADFRGHAVSKRTAGPNWREVRPCATRVLGLHQNFPSNDLASNATFYLGEIAYAQDDFKGAIASYETVLTNYPKSFKLPASLLKKAMAELELGMKASGIRDLREVERRFAGSDEARRAQAKLRELGAAPGGPPPRAREGQSRSVMRERCRAASPGPAA